MRRKAQPHHVTVLVYDRLATFEFAIAVEVFGLPRPELLPVDWYRFSVCSLEGSSARATGGVRVAAPRGLRALAKADTIVIPGWRDPDEIPPAALLDALRRASRRGARLMSICSGVFVLAATGLLDGKRATTHWRYVDKLRELYPRIRVEPDVLYIDEKNILTSAGSAAGIDLCLHVVRTDYGAEIANQVARRLVVPPHRDGGQAQYVREPVRSERSGGLSPTMEWALGRLRHRVTVGDLARHANMSMRTFARRFVDETGTTPHRWLTHQRLILAQRRLEVTRDSIDEVAEAAGFDTAETLRLHFRQTFGTSPSSYRRRFSVAR
ncbi:MAG TPA: transcriptional regulator FtrA [Thermoanaerobaculia bacterium]|nr:transcriptional regulator FtrA [Thermoanaerobaculia bacterium]